ncbi:MAG: phenylalanine--tRNA ligase subunit beta [Bacteroidetes bacterium 4572_112]|nr:MAG: phenylalanine--tRNA ligase subunit beta [Bacteroidetes bacterium 4572_112]
MKLSYNWLKKYIDLDIDANKLSILLTDCGLEVEGMEKFESIKGSLQGIKVGKVMSCEKHPNADKLSKTMIDLGTGELLPIVCGAPNVAEGQTVLIATVGTTLYDGDDSFVIKKSKIRGEASMGMICAEDELQIGESHDGIMVLEGEYEIGADASKYFPVETDYVYEIGLTPNRADATSHIGSARDLVAVINRFYPEKRLILNKPSVDNFKVDNNNLPIEISIKDTDACARYSGLCIENVKIAESPEWLKNSLKAVGLRPINNIVDISNYILMETGHPLHIFDYDKIAGAKVNVQTLAKDTKFTTLDEVERKLNAEDLMICDAEKPMCIAGVFGGLNSGVSDTTTNIFIESAYFNAVSVRKTSKRHTLKTDASFRFERGADANITVYALKLAALLIQEIAGGNIASEIVDEYPRKLNNWNVDLRYDKLNKLIGQEIDRSMVKSIITDLDMIIIEETDDKLKLEIPTFKVDVTREVDVIEEVLRVFGYNNINFDNQIRSSINFIDKPERDYIQSLISEFLVSNGFNEIMNNSLTKASYYENKDGFDASKSVQILNPLSSELNVLRQSLVFGGLESLKRNINYKAFDIHFYEFGKHYRIQNPDATDVTEKYHESMHLGIFMSGKKVKENWSFKQSDSNYYDLKGILAKLFNRFGIANNKLKVSESKDANFAYALDYTFANKHIATIGKVANLLTAELDIKQEVFYLDINFDNFLSILHKFKVQFNDMAKFPAVRRDLALLVNHEINYEQIEAIARKVDKKLLQSVNLFDVYEGKGVEEGKKSYAISLIFQDKDKTLRDKIVDKAVNKMVFILEKELGAKLR